MDQGNPPQKTWKLRTRELSLETPKIMGILNVTSDSFSDGGKFLDPEAALAHALQLEKEGADILDIGAESTRPGALSITSEEEWARLKPLLPTLSRKLKVPISLDTRNASTAALAMEWGVEIINDVSCASREELLRIAAKAGVGYVLMHSRGEPQNMMELARYENLLSEIRVELKAGLERALKEGIHPANICLDPGFGFAKNSEQNFKIIENLASLTTLGYPLLVGLSRKRMLRERVGEDPELLKRASATAAVLAVEGGARILRVHDVAETKAALKVWQENL